MAGKKNFKEQAGNVLNPAMQFITPPADQTAPASISDIEPEIVPDIDAPDELTPRPRPEAKSRRVQLLMRPTTHNAIQAEADELGLSVNEWINFVLEGYLKKRGKI